MVERRRCLTRGLKAHEVWKTDDGQVEWHGGALEVRTREVQALWWQAGVVRRGGGGANLEMGELRLEDRTMRFGCRI